MAQLYHLTLLTVFLFLLLTGLLAADLSGGKMVGKKVGKKVTMTVRYPAEDSGEKITISTHLVGEGGVGDNHLHLDGDDYEPMIFAVKNLVSALEKVGDPQASLSESDMEVDPERCVSVVGDATVREQGAGEVPTPAFGAAPAPPLSPLVFTAMMEDGTSRGGDAQEYEVSCTAGRVQHAADRMVADASYKAAADCQVQGDGHACMLQPALISGGDLGADLKDADNGEASLASDGVLRHLNRSFGRGLDTPDLAAQPVEISVDEMHGAHHVRGLLRSCPYFEYEVHQW
ncbi:hypothetical protein ZWY2020_037438 [Hordeum vulgare]|nr:hypothetical protein ZWY2020_037438 [Hordeum vulgare]